MGRSSQWTPYLLLLPILVLGFLFFLGIGNALIQSLGYIPAFDMTDFTLQYYQEAFQEPTLLASIRVSLVIALVSSVLATIFGVLLCAALVLNGKVGGKILQVIKLPILIPHMVVALFVIMFFSQNGLLARILYALNLLHVQGDFPALLFSTNNTGIIIAYLWKEVPFVAYFVLALMASINTTLGEAAENLGASGIKSFFYVTLPLSMPAVHKAFLIIFAFSFGAYELPFLLGATLPKALPVQAYIEYIDPDLRHRSYAMAMNGVMLLITLAISAVYYLLSGKTNQTSGDRNEI
ncbi:ABC transporter permease [Candidatus Formimonas warabiya]|uniref:Spermidine/putrescine ABC transporter permease n=1 Tax=Formimonas warabiya TaxID=1761012 RepID=A0A3G1KUK6_FORW1|nr:ABC transporter permease subunit [Candidatus Formimonas warabiya]ATW26139.1 spermidine/putrescine ABC transporter permease [Candidatus Formimonas warabiya]